MLSRLLFVFLDSLPLHALRRRPHTQMINNHVGMAAARPSLVDFRILIRSYPIRSGLNPGRLACLPSRISRLKSCLSIILLYDFSIHFRPRPLISTAVWGNLSLISTHPASISGPYRARLSHWLSWMIPGENRLVECGGVALRNICNQSRLDLL
jgi:hypothetical protein